MALFFPSNCLPQTSQNFGGATCLGAFVLGPALDVDGSGIGGGSSGKGTAAVVGGDGVVLGASIEPGLLEHPPEMDDDAVEGNAPDPLLETGEMLFKLGSFIGVDGKDLIPSNEWSL